MATASQKKQAPSSRRIGVDLCERLDLSASNVDRENCTIRNVKILGATSPNRHGLDVEGTDYLPCAHQQAKSLYEGVLVNVGHPPRHDPDAERHPPDRNGVLRNIHIRNNETFGDWKLIPSHPMTQTFLDCAEDPDLHNQFALSHNAKGYGTVRENRYQISEIPRVRSVDVVAHGGTNKSLFESQETKTMKKKFKDIIEAASEKVRDRWRPLLEMYEDVGEMAMDAPAPPADGGEPGHMDHLGSLLKALIDDVKNGKMEPQEAIDKILAAVKVMEETKEEEIAPPGEVEGDEGTGEGEAVGAEVEAKESAEPAKKTKAEITLESREKAVKEKEELLKVRDLCESLDFKEDAIQRKMMIPLTDAERRQYIKQQKGLKPVAAKAPTTPRTGAGRTTNVQESTAVRANGNLDFADMTTEAIAKRAAFFKN